MVLRFLILTAVTAILAWPQAMVQYGAAAAGGGAAGVAGKPVSDGIDKIFGKLGGAAKQAAADDTAEEWRKKQQGVSELGAVPGGRPQAPPPPVFQVRAKQTDGSQTTLGPLVNVNSTPVAAAPAPAVPTVEAAQAAPPVPVTPPVTAEMLEAVMPGAGRAEVLAQLGPPYSKIVIPEDSTTREIYRYRNGAAVVGTLELLDGKVESVRWVKLAER